MTRKLIQEDLLRWALIGLQAERERIDAIIASLRNGGGLQTRAKAVEAKPRRTISAAARKRMSQGQKQRWKALKQAKS